MVFEIIKQRKKKTCQDCYAVSALPDLLALMLWLSCEME